MIRIFPIFLFVSCSLTLDLGDRASEYPHDADVEVSDDPAIETDEPNRDADFALDAASDTDLPLDSSIDVDEPEEADLDTSFVDGDDADPDVSLVDADDSGGATDAPMDVDFDADVPVIYDSGRTGDWCIIEAQRVASRSCSSCPKITWTGDEYGLLWNDRRSGNTELYFAHRTPNTELEEVEIISGQSLICSSDFVWSGEAYGVAYAQGDAENSEIFFVTLDQDGTRTIEGEQISFAQGYSIHPSITKADDGFVVAWQDQRSENWQIYCSLLSSSGDVTISESAGPIYGEYPSIAFNGAEYGIAWQYANSYSLSLRFSRLSSELEFISFIYIDTDIASPKNPDLLWTGEEYLLAWAGMFIAPSSPDLTVGDDLFVTSFGPTGEEEQRTERVTTADKNSNIPSIVLDDSGLGIAWQDLRTYNWEIYFTRTSITGSSEARPLRITESAAASQCPSIVWTGEEYGITWLEQGDANQIWFARIGPC